MARYRKVDPRIWNDAKFRGLSDNAKLVFFMLLTHPSMTALGAMRATVAGLAAEMGWSAEAFGEAFRDVIAKGMAEHDPKACFVGLPNFIRYNEPESPNVVKAWVGSLDLLPECEQRSRTIARAVAFAEAKGKAFAEALPEAFREAWPKTMPNQEQEQEQEQEERGAQAAPTPPKPSKLKREEITLAEYISACEAKNEKPIRAHHPVRAWAEKAGLSDEMLSIAWVLFRERYTEDEQYKRKRYKDWPGHFCNAVKGNWFKLWYEGDAGTQWTTQGLMHKKVREAEHA